MMKEKHYENKTTQTAKKSLFLTINNNSFNKIKSVGSFEFFIFMRNVFRFLFVICTASYITEINMKEQIAGGNIFERKICNYTLLEY